MIPSGPQFLDENERVPRDEPATAKPGVAPTVEAPLPRGPVLLEPEPNAPERLEFGWKPDVVAAARRRHGAATWVAAGLCTIVLAWVALSMVSFVLTLLAQSLAMATLAALTIGAGLLMLAYAASLELQAYRALGTVDRLRKELGSAKTTLAVARREARVWLHQIRASIPDSARVDRMLEHATTVAEVRGILRSQVADRLREVARAVGKRAAVDGAALVAICPHPAWDGIIAGGRSLSLIRQVAAVYGLRPGFAVTLGLARRVAWTAAGTVGLALVSQRLADHLLSDLPVVKHVAGAFPETAQVAVRLYRLAAITAEACSPIPE